HEG
ncbi:zf-CCHC domain-containing protein/DUF4219 domain-containing protein/UBN2 domain-containing protein, partial [Cephalotus follicularis]